MRLVKLMLKLKLFLKIAFVILLVSASSPTRADTAVWEVSKDGSTVYLGGTIHVLSAADYPLPQAFEVAYQKSEIVFFEVDIAELSGGEFLSLLGRKSAYPLGTTLKSKLSDSTWLLFDAAMKELGLSAYAVNHLRPGAVMSTLMSLEMIKLGMVADGVDRYFYEQSAADKKQTGSLETAEQQVQLITELGQGNEDEFIQYLVEDLKSFSSQFVALKGAWLHGDNSQLSTLSRLDELKAEDPAMYQAILDDRNRAWLPLIENMFQSPAVELVLVGALHLVGEDGLLHLLTEKGYQVKQMQAH